MLIKYKSDLGAIISWPFVSFSVQCQAHEGEEGAVFLSICLIFQFRVDVCVCVCLFDGAPQWDHLFLAAHLHEWRSGLKSGHHFLPTAVATVCGCVCMCSQNVYFLYC